MWDISEWFSILGSECCYILQNTNWMETQKCCQNANGLNSLDCISSGKDQRKGGRFYKYKTQWLKKIIIERVIIDIVCRSRCPVKSLLKVTFFFYNGGLCGTYLLCRWGMFCCNTLRGCWETLVVRLSSSALSRFYYTSIFSHWLIIS